MKQSRSRSLVNQHANIIHQFQCPYGYDQHHNHSWTNMQALLPNSTALRGANNIQSTHVQAFRSISKALRTAIKIPVTHDKINTHYSQYQQPFGVRTLTLIAWISVQAFKSIIFNSPLSCNPNLDLSQINVLQYPNFIALGWGLTNVWPIHTLVAILNPYYDLHIARSWSN